MAMGRQFLTKNVMPAKKSIFVRSIFQRSVYVSVCLLLLSGILIISAICSKLQGPSLLQYLVSFTRDSNAHVIPFNCWNSSQGKPVLAHEVEGVMHPFIVSLSDLGSPGKPNRNFERVLKGKNLQRCPVGTMIQRVLTRLRPEGSNRRPEWVVDVGANVGMATYAASAMGFRVLSIEPVFENMQRLCDGLYLNRATHLVELYHAALSDRHGTLTIHKVLGRLDNSATSAKAAVSAFPSNKVVPLTVRSTTVDCLVAHHDPVVLIKIDVQGHEFHVLRGAAKLLARPGLQAPFLVYEEDERLLQENNSSSRQILQFLEVAGYKYCRKEGMDRHCWKENT